MLSLSKELYKLAHEASKLEAQSTDFDHETVYHYYYDKGGLDFRDKILSVVGGLPQSLTATAVLEVLQRTFPDRHPEV